MWNALIDKAQAQGRARPPLRMFSKAEVMPNETGVCCLDNEHVMRIDTGMPSDKAKPIHAHRTRPQSPDIGTGKVIYAAGQSPHVESFKDFVAQALESKQGIFEIVSRKAHYDAEQSTQKSIIDLLKVEIAKPRDGDSALMFGNRYKYQSLHQVAGKGHAQDAQDFVRYELTVIDPDGITIKIPLTQAGLRFTGRVLRPAEIQRADSLLDAHQVAVESVSDADQTESPKVQLILSRAGAGRNATLISYHKIACLIEYGQVTDATLDDALEEEIHAERMRRGPGYVHSIEQLASLRTALQEKIVTMPPLTAPGITASARRRSAPAWLTQTVSNAQPLLPLHQMAATYATPATGAAQRPKSSKNAEAETIPVRPASPFSRLTFDQKIQALLDAADNQINRATAYDASFLDLETTQIDSRNLTAKECLGFALEIALEKRRAQIPDISLRLARILNAEDQMIPLFGVNFPRARIEAWSRQESLPKPVQVYQEFIAKDNELGTTFAGNVHSDPVRAAGEKQLNAMKDRTAIGLKKTVEQTHAEILDYIATLPPSESALKGLNKIVQYTGGEFNDDSSPFLAIVWGYIEQCSNQDMKQNLRDSMIIKLAEIATENPCSEGIIERIIDIPTAIDFSLLQDIPEEEVFTELAQMADHINELVEENYVFDCSGARAAAGVDEKSPARIAVETTISDLKRDMFLEKARIELAVLRDIDSNFVIATANEVFLKAQLFKQR